MEPRDVYARRVAAGRELLRDLLTKQAAGDTVDFSILDGVPGVRLVPTTWEELQASIADGSPEALGALGRSPERLRSYQSYRETFIHVQFASVTDYLYHELFGIPTVPGHHGRQVAITPPDFRQTRRTVWRENDFPYLFEPGVVHMNLWSNQPLSEEELVACIRQELPRDAESCWFINPPVLQSVPAIWHAHVLWRRRPAQDGGVQQQAVQQEEEEQQQQRQQQVVKQPEERQQQGQHTDGSSGKQRWLERIVRQA